MQAEEEQSLRDSGMLSVIIPIYNEEKYIELCSGSKCCW